MRMFLLPTVPVLLLSLLFSSPAKADISLSLELHANNGSRWYEYFSGAYAELGRIHSAGTAQGGTADGFFNIANDAEFGAANVFVNDNFFSNSYSLTFDDTAPITGVGIEIRNITGFTFNFANDIADDDSILNAGYTTTTSNFAGTVTFTNGVLSSIDGSSDVRFAYDASSLGAGILNYGGLFTVAGNQWLLDVDDTNITGFGEFRYRWNVSGTVLNVVPEPGSAVLLGLGLAAVTWRRKRS